MSHRRGLPKEIEKLFRAKRERRQELARLPFEKKIAILVELQKIASGVKPPHGDILRSVWPIHSESPSNSSLSL